MRNFKSTCCCECFLVLPARRIKVFLKMTVGCSLFRGKTKILLEKTKNPCYNDRERRWRCEKAKRSILPPLFRCFAWLRPLLCVGAAMEKAPVPHSWRAPRFRWSPFCCSSLPTPSDKNEYFLRLKKQACLAFFFLPLTKCSWCDNITTDI